MTKHFFNLFFLLFSLSLGAQSAGTYLLLSDADMAASAYITGELKQQAGVRDSLILLQIDEAGESTSASIALSNSVTNWVKSVAVSADAKTTYVLQTRGEAPDSLQKVENVFTDLPKGMTLTSVNISNPQSPEVKDTLTVGSYPTSIVLSPDGKHLALTVEEKHSEILLIPLAADGGFQGVFRHPHAIYSKENNIRATDIAWHPSGKFLSVTLEEDKTLAFYKLISTNYGTRLALLGAPVPIGDLPGKSEFTPDGKYCLITNIRDWVSPSEIIAVRFDEGGNHEISSRVDVGRAAENFVLSPDGKHIAALNMEGAHFPAEMEDLHTTYSTVSLLSVNKEGELTTVDKLPFPGILPEGIIYDETGKHLTVAVFEYLEDSTGGLEFFEITEAGKLLHKPKRIKLPRGLHFIKEVKTE